MVDEGPARANGEASAREPRRLKNEGGDGGDERGEDGFESALGDEAGAGGFVGRRVRVRSRRRGLVAFAAALLRARASSAREPSRVHALAISPGSGGGAASPSRAFFDVTRRRGGQGGAGDPRGGAANRRANAKRREDAR